MIWKTPQSLTVFGILLVALLLVSIPKERALAQNMDKYVYLPTIRRAIPVATSAPTPTPLPSGPGDQLVALVNEARAEQGCEPLAINAALTEAALAHSTDMAEHDFFSHTGSDGSSPWDRMARAGYTYSAAAENLAAGYTAPEQVVSGWLGSAGHRANMLNCALQETGVGYVYAENDPGQVTYHYYWTAMFGTPR